MLTLKTLYWTYKPKLIPSYVFEPFYEIIQEYIFPFTSSNKKRVSCYFSDSDKEIGYNGLIRYNWSDAPEILIEIRKLVEQHTQESYDYVLVHIYKDGSAGINWHNDSEALESSIASISLGTTRKFRLKKIGRKTGYDSQLYLNDGDLIWMHGPDKESGRLSCQQVYYHCVPVERKVKGPRINLTFRQY